MPGSSRSRQMFWLPDSSGSGDDSYYLLYRHAASPRAMDVCTSFIAPSREGKLPSAGVVRGCGPLGFCFIRRHKFAVHHAPWSERAVCVAAHEISRIVTVRAIFRSHLATQRCTHLRSELRAHGMFERGGEDVCRIQRRGGHVGTGGRFSHGAAFQDGGLFACERTLDGPTERRPVLYLGSQGSVRQRCGLPCGVNQAVGEIYGLGHEDLESNATLCYDRLYQPVCNGAQPPANALLRCTTPRALERPLSGGYPVPAAAAPLARLPMSSPQHRQPALSRCSTRACCAEISRVSLTKSP